MRAITPHEKECAEAALAVLLERAVGKRDRKEASSVRRAIKELRARPIENSKFGWAMCEGPFPNDCCASKVECESQ